MAVVEKVSRQPDKRNPGPPFGYQLMNMADRWFPERFKRACISLGSAIGASRMDASRASSGHYLGLVLQHPPTRKDINLHFEAFAESLLQRLRLTRGIQPRFYFENPDAGKEFEELCRSDQQALFGTFHVGQSDLLGCMLSHFGRRIAMVRHRVSNSCDVEIMERTFSEWVKILWINEPRNFLFELKEALDAGLSIGIQCDRIEHGGRLVPLEFLGARRQFPFTIYNLAKMFDLPVAFAFAGQPTREGGIPVITTPVFRPGDHSDPTAAGKAHFQQVLISLQNYLEKNPYIWFNFGDLNPPQN